MGWLLLVWQSTNSPSSVGFCLHGSERKTSPVLTQQRANTNCADQPVQNRQVLRFVTGLQVVDAVEFKCPCGGTFCCIQLMVVSCTLLPPSDVTDCGFQSLILVVVSYSQHWLMDVFKAHSSGVSSLQTCHLGPGGICMCVSECSPADT